MGLSSLSIALPAFNEERVIEKTIGFCKKAVERLVSDYEILVIDDGSRDQTGEIVRRLSSANSHIKRISLSKQMGYGKALSTAFYSANKEFIFYTDADAPIDILKELSHAVSLVSDDVDVVIGYRTNRQDTTLRRTYSIIYNFLCRTFLGIKVQDVNFSCKLFRKEIFNKIKLYSHSVFIDAEILANVNYFGFKMKEFPATYVPRMSGRSNFDSPIYAFKVFIELIVFFVRKKILHKK